MKSPPDELYLVPPEITRRAFDLFKRRIEKVGKKERRRLKWRGRGAATTNVYGFSTSGIWILCQRGHPTTRKHATYWIACGFYPPRENPIPVVIQFNMAEDNKDPNTSAAFLNDAAGRFYLGHKGGIGGILKGATRQAFLRKCTMRNRVYIRERDREMFVFGLSTRRVGSTR